MKNDVFKNYKNRIHKANCEIIDMRGAAILFLKHNQHLSEEEIDKSDEFNNLLKKLDEKREQLEKLKEKEENLKKFIEFKFNDMEREYLFNFVTKIKEVRENKKISIRKLAKMCNMSYSNYCNFENGKANLSFSNLIKVLSFLGIELSEGLKNE